MHKLITKLSYFRFNTSINKDFLITWYVLEEDEEGGRPFTDKERNQFLDYAVKNEINFTGDKNTFQCSEEEPPFCGIETVFQNNDVSFPKYVILRPKPELSYGKILTCMDIELTNTAGSSNHNYILPFNVIGVIG